MGSLAPGDHLSSLDEPSTHPLPDSFWWPSPPLPFLPPPAHQSFISDPYLSQNAPAFPYIAIPNRRASLSAPFWSYGQGDAGGHAIIGYTHFIPPGGEEGTPRVFYAPQPPIAPPPLSFSIPSTFITDKHPYQNRHRPLAPPQHSRPLGYYPPPFVHATGHEGRYVPTPATRIPRKLSPPDDAIPTYWPSHEVQEENRKEQMQSYVEKVRREKRRGKESRACRMALDITKADCGDDVDGAKANTESHYINTMTEVIAYQIPKLAQDQLYIWRTNIWIHHLALDPDGLPTQHVTFTFQRRFAPDHSLVIHVTPMSPWERHNPRRWPDELFYNVACVAYPPQWAWPRDRMVDHEAYVKWERARHRMAMCKDEMGRGTRWARTLAREHMLEVRWRPKPPKEMEKWVVTEGSEPVRPGPAPGVARGSSLNPPPAYTVATPATGEGKSAKAESGEGAIDPAPAIDCDLLSDSDDAPTTVLPHPSSSEHPSHTPTPTNIHISASVGASDPTSESNASRQQPSPTSTGLVALDDTPASPQPAAEDKTGGVWGKDTALPPGLLAKFRKMAM